MRLPLTLLGGALAAALLTGAAQARPAEVANPFTTAASKKAMIHFVPLDARSRALVVATLPSVKRWLRDPTEITAIPTSKPNWMNAERRKVIGIPQMNARAVTTDLKSRFVRAQGNKVAFLIGVTSASLYNPENPLYGFVFGVRSFSGGGSAQAMAMIATSEMRFYKPERERARFTKMLLRYIGEVVCGLPRNDDTKSVMYEVILSAADLDRMVATLPSRC